MDKVLIVDDNQKNIQLLANILQSQGYDVEYAMNGIEAIDTVKNDNFDIILMDIMMPEMDGLEATTHIKKIETKKDIPVIFLTGRTDTESIKKGFLVGGVDYLSKPFNPEELISRIGTHISLKKKKEELHELNNTLENKVNERTQQLFESKEKLQLAYDELKILDSAKNDFLAIISHEMRTPLNGMIGVYEILKDSIKEQEHLDYLDMMNATIQRLNSFLITALDISYLNTKKYESMDMDKIDFNSFMNKTILELHENKQLDNIQHRFEITPCTVRFDEEWMSKSIKIILNNAIKHSGENAKIKFTSKILSDTYIIEIHDSGKGFPEEIIKFGINSFSNKSHYDMNPGLDLYLAKLIIEAHGYEMELDNNNGAIVRIKIPL